MCCGNRPVARLQLGSTQSSRGGKGTPFPPGSLPWSVFSHHWQQDWAGRPEGQWPEVRWRGQAQTEPGTGAVQPSRARGREPGCLLHNHPSRARTPVHTLVHVHAHTGRSFPR